MHATDKLSLPKTALNSDRLTKVFEALRDQIGNWYLDAYGSVQPHEEMIKCYSWGTVSRINTLLGPTKFFTERTTPRRILDTGCGYGSIAVMLAHIWPNTEVLAIDQTDHYFQCGLAVARQMKMQNLRFLKMRVEHLEIPDSCDLVICCNMLNFLNSKQLLEQGLSNIGRSVSNDGYMVVHTPHFWSLREPFTKIPFLHYLPPAWQDFVVRRAGKRSLLSDTRNPSLREISQVLRSNGLCLKACSPKWALSRLRSTHFTAWFDRNSQGQ